MARRYWWMITAGVVAIVMSVASYETLLKPNPVSQVAWQRTDFAFPSFNPSLPRPPVAAASRPDATGRVSAELSATETRPGLFPKKAAAPRQHARQQESASEGVPVDAAAPPPGPPEPTAQSTCEDQLHRAGVIGPAGSACTDLDDVLNHLEKGTYSFNKPDTVTLNEPFPIRLMLQTQSDQAVDFSGTPGAVESKPDIAFAQTVLATVSGDDFDISPSGAQERTAARSLPVEWDWRLIPKSSGTKTITIQVEVQIAVGADKHRIQLPAFREAIDIHVTMFQHLKAFVATTNGLIIAAAALVAPLSLLFGLVPKFREALSNLLVRIRRREPAPP